MGWKWTRDDVLSAKAMFDNGAEYPEIGSALGRSPDAIYCILKKHYGAKLLGARPAYTDGPPIGLTVECKRYVKDCKLGSEVLRGLVMDLLNRMTPAEVADVLGVARAVEPGTERTRKTAELMRLAA